MTLDETGGEVLPRIVVIADGREERMRIADASVRAMGSSLAACLKVDARTLPFTIQALVRPESAAPIVLRIDDLDLAFRDHQATATRLVLTGSMYLLQKLDDALRPGDRIVATADPAMLRHDAPEAYDQRGPWRWFDLIPGGRIDDASAAARQRDARGAESVETLAEWETPARVVADHLADAYARTSGPERVALCRAVVDGAPESAVAQLALASALREQQDAAAAKLAFDRAVQLAPDWEAAHYEYGKFWLACDSLELARIEFQRAVELMPTFAAAHSNLGATLGELDDPEAALAAFTRALVHDPTSSTILNNVGVVSRELGRLDQSEAALTRVVGLAPAYVFGHYNLGHTRFLRGDYAGAMAAYEAGQRRDPEQNRRQGCRLAVVRFANGDVDRARLELARFAGQAMPDEREDLFLEAYEIVEALIEVRPELTHHRAFLEWIGNQVRA